MLGERHFDMEPTDRKNKEYYDRLYGSTDLSELVDKVRRRDEFLNDAIATKIAWAGIYAQDFRCCLQGKRILEIGAGRGLNSLIMAALGAKVVSVDISNETPRIINNVASTLGLESRIEATAGDFLEIEFQPCSFDFVVGKAFLHHLTHTLEREYVRKSAVLLNETGEARFFEPAVNSVFLDKLRWMLPVPGRPSCLNRRSFAAWSSEDLHPSRDNSSEHFRRLGQQFFSNVTIIPSGGLERFSRYFEQAPWNPAFKGYAFRIEKKLPFRVQMKIARSQTIIFRHPRRCQVEGRARGYCNI